MKEVRMIDGTKPKQASGTGTLVVEVKMAATGRKGAAGAGADIKVAPVMGVRTNG
jgi:hypothetical protein